MKTKSLLTWLMLIMAVSASAQIEVLYFFHNGEYTHWNVIDRTKKLYWLDDEDNTCFNVQDYKVSGNQATFILKIQEASPSDPIQQMRVSAELDAKGKIVKIHYKDKSPTIYKDLDVKTNDHGPSRGDIEYHNHLIRFFNEKAGYPTDQGINSGAGVSAVGGKVPAVEEKNPAVEEKNPANKVKDAAKNAVGKMKGLFKKKK